MKPFADFDRQVMVDEFEDFRDSLEEQLAEVELLQAMFPGQNELEIEEGGVEEVNAWLRGDTPVSLLPAPLELRLRLEVGVGVELIASLPPGYPFKTLPELYVRGEKLSRKTQAEVNGELGEFLASQVARSRKGMDGVNLSGGRRGRFGGSGQLVARPRGNSLGPRH